MSTSKFFDLHFHPLQKQFLTDFNLSQDSEKLSKKVVPTKKLIKILDKLFLKLFESQSCINQINENGPSIGIANIVPVELGIAASKKFGFKILESSIVDPIDSTYFKNIANGEVSYLHLFLRELSLYEYLRKNDLVNFCSRNHQSRIDEEKPNFILSIEGGHSLLANKIGRDDEKDEGFRLGVDGSKRLEKKYNKVLKTCQLGKPAFNLETLVKFIWKKNMDVLYLTLTHLTHIAEEPLATHAYGAKFINHSSLFPQGIGLSTKGKEVIQSAYELKNGDKSRPILIDIKHMSWHSRKEFYQFRKDRKFDHIPIMATHMGVTGYNIHEWQNALKEDKCCQFSSDGMRSIRVETEPKFIGDWGSTANTKFFLNPWSINLMDEDIIEILISKGLIGISLDQRILGFQDAKDKILSPSSPEHLSRAEFISHFPDINLNNIDPCISDDTYDGRESKFLPTKKERHALYLCFNIIHIHVVGTLTSSVTTEPLDHVCIGSDFDGLIDPINVCTDVTQLGNLEYNLKKWLPVAAKQYQKENAASDEVYKKFLNEDSLNKTIRNIMYNNGKNFIDNWMKDSTKSES